MDIQQIQRTLSDLRLDGWLLYDFKGINTIANTLLKLPEGLHATRRYCYFIPVSGDPKKLVHRIESQNLDGYPGEKNVYLSWQSYKEGLKTILSGFRKIAMEYSPDNAIPYISRVDAGTVELIRSLGKEIHSSADLVQETGVRLNDDQIECHIAAAKQIRQFVYNAFDEIHSRITKFGEIKEHAVQQFLTRRCGEHNLIADHPPIVAVNANAGDPHYSPREDESAVIKSDNLVLIDLWAKLPKNGAIYADITWMGYTGTTIPDEYKHTFSIVTKARDRAFSFIEEKFFLGKPIKGWEVDDVTRNVIGEAGYGENFIHRTGHSIGEEVHSNGTNLDNLETHDSRTIIPRTCFSIEPGIYTESFGVRTEINVIISSTKEVLCTGGTPQKEIIAI